MVLSMVLALCLAYFVSRDAMSIIQRLYLSSDNEMRKARVSTFHPRIVLVSSGRPSLDNFLSDKVSLRFGSSLM